MSLRQLSLGSSPTSLGVFRSLPPELRHRIFHEAALGEELHGDIIIDDAGLPARSIFPIFYLSHDLRAEILETILPTRATLVFYRPIALSNFLAQESPEGPPPSRLLHRIRVVIFHELKLGDKSGANAKLYSAWMDAFDTLPSNIKSIKIDLEHNFRIEMNGVAHLLHHLSATVRSHTDEKAQLGIRGWGTAEETRSLVNAWKVLSKETTEHGIIGEQKPSLSHEGVYPTPSDEKDVRRQGELLVNGIFQKMLTKRSR